MNFRVDINGPAHRKIDYVDRDHNHIQTHVSGRDAPAGMIDSDIGVIGKPWDCGEQRGYDTEGHRVERTEHEMRCSWKCKRGDIEKQTQNEQPDRKMDQHWMNRMPQRFAFENILQHNESLRWKVRTTRRRDLP